MQKTGRKNCKDIFSNPGNERAVLSCLIKDLDLFIEHVGAVTTEDFLSTEHSTIFSLLYSLYEQNVSKFDFMTVVNEANDQGVTDIAGGVDYINALFNVIIDTTNIDLFVGKLLDCSGKYKLYMAAKGICKKIKANASSDGKEASVLTSEAESSILEVALEADRADDAVDVSQGLQERLKKLAENPVSIVGTSTGFDTFDRLVGGLTPNSLTVIAARAKVGKSVMLANIARHLAFKLGQPVLYFDTEMSTDEVQMRMLSNLSQVPMNDIITGKFAKSDRASSRVYKAMSIIYNDGNVFHKFCPGFSVDAVKSMAKKYKVRHGIGAIFFDYLKLPDASNLNNAKEHQYLGFLTAALKDLSGTLKIPVVTAAQIGRDGAGRSKMSSEVIADSDRIFRYCTTLCALSRKSAEELEQDTRDSSGVPMSGTHRLQVLDARNGGQCYEGINLIGDLSRLTFREARYQIPGLGGTPREMGSF